MKLLLTSGGISNKSIKHALIEMLIKPMVSALQRAEKMDITSYVVDDDTTFQVVNNKVSVISGGTWKVLKQK